MSAVDDDVSITVVPSLQEGELEGAQCLCDIIPV